MPSNESHLSPAASRCQQETLGALARIEERFYDRDTHVARPRVDLLLGSVSWFAARTTPATLVLGDAGVGKSCVIASLAWALCEYRSSTVLYLWEFERSADWLGDVLASISGGKRDLAGFLEWWNDPSNGGARSLWVLLDGLDGSPRFRAYLTELETALGSAAWRAGFRLVVACRKNSLARHDIDGWPGEEGLGFPRSEGMWTRFMAGEKSLGFLEICGFSDEEIDFFGARFEPEFSLPEHLRPLARLPLHLSLLRAMMQAGHVPPDDLREDDVVAWQLRSLVSAHPGLDGLLVRVGHEMLARRRSVLPAEIVWSLHGAIEHGACSGALTSSGRLLEALVGVLVLLRPASEDHGPRDFSYTFRHRQQAEQVLLRTIESDGGIRTAEQLTSWCRQAEGFDALRGALEHLASRLAGDASARPLLVGLLDLEWEGPEQGFLLALLRREEDIAASPAVRVLEEGCAGNADRTRRLSCALRWLTSELEAEGRIALARTLCQRASGLWSRIGGPVVGPENRREYGLLLALRGRLALALGAHREAQIVAEKRLALARSLADQTDRLDLCLDLAAALFLVSEAWLALDLTDRALDGFEEHLALLRTLSDQHPEHPALRRRLAASLLRVGDAWLSLGRSGGALRHLIESVEIGAELSERQPANELLDRDFSVALDVLGHVLIDLGRPGDAVCFLARSFALRCRLFFLAPALDELRRDLAAIPDRTENNVPTISPLGDTLRELQEDLSSLRQLVEPQAVEPCVDLARALDSMRLVWSILGCAKESLGCVREQIALLRGFPGHTSACQALAVQLGRLARASWEENRPKAEGYLQEGIMLMRALRRQEPRNVAFLVDLIFLLGIRTHDVPEDGKADKGAGLLQDPALHRDLQEARSLANELESLVSSPVARRVLEERFSHWWDERSRG